MSDPRWVKAWPTDFRQALKNAGYDDQTIDLIMQVETMQQAVSRLRKDDIARNKAIAQALQERFGHRPM